MRIVRVSVEQRLEALELLAEYYEAVDVVKRDTLADVEGFLRDEGSGLWIAYVEEIPAGCVVLRPLPSMRFAGECKRLYVRSQFRGRGIAEALLDAMEDYGRVLGLKEIYLDSKDDLTVAINLYKKRQYETCAAYNDNPQATIFMRKVLTAY
jgi:GNAT superfamily N-acetyltransferase